MHGSFSIKYCVVVGKVLITDRLGTIEMNLIQLMGTI